ncbi:MAG TPA: glucose PTS transporter subunit IIA [Bacilli bacterium]
MNWMGNLQQLGRSLVMPMIALPAAAIFIFLSNFAWHGIGLADFGYALLIAGNAIFEFLPMIFAIGVALGLTENSGTAGMSSLLGYLLCTSIIQHYEGPSFEFGVTGGIIIGLLAAFSFHRFKNVKLPEYIQFFGGPRFVTLFMCFASLVFSWVFIKVGPYLQYGMLKISAFVLDLGGFGTFLYGVLYRLSVPTGLHHILNNVMWFQVGSYERPDGQLVHGDLPRFFAGDAEAGIYMAGLYPIMMFALPAIAFAIIHEAREDLKPKVKIIFVTAALTSFITGVTEPIEFAFLFVAPYLFIVHAVLSGLAMWIAHYLDIHHGFSFSAGVIDYFINLHLSKNGLWLIPIGIVYALVYYLLFRFAIRRFRIPTPGREEGSQFDEWVGDIPYRAPLILQALGGKGNIVLIEACITRLRLTLANDRLMDTAALKHLGAAGVIRLGGGNVQVVFGTFSELIREEIMKTLRKDFRQILFNSPVQGKMIPIEDVPDKIFAGKIVGNGVAFIPERGELVSPVTGKVVHIYPTKHAIGIITDEGLEVLLHVGIDTSHLQNMFTSFVEVGDEVNAGQLLIRFDLNRLKKLSKSIATPMVVTNPLIVKSWSFAPYKAVKKGQVSVMSVVLKEMNKNGGK